MMKCCTTILFRCRLCLLLVFALAGTTQAVEYDWTGNGDGVSWEDPLNWDPNDQGAPGGSTTDEVTFVGPDSVVYNSVVSIAKLTLVPGMTLTLNSDLQVKKNVVVDDVGDGDAVVNGTGFLVALDDSNTTIKVHGDLNDRLLIDNLQYQDDSMLIVENGGTVIVTETFDWVTSTGAALRVDTDARFVVNSSFTIPLGATLEVQDAALEIGGDFTNNGTFTSNTSTVIFTDESTLGGSGFAFYNLTINAGAAITLDNDIAVNNNFVNNGTLTGATHKVTFTSGTAAVTGSGTNNFHDLSIQAGAVVELSGVEPVGISVSGTLQIDGVLSCGGDNAIEITGVWLNNNGPGGFLENTSVVEFGGITPTLPNVAESFHDITISSLHDSVARADYTVSGTWRSDTSRFLASTFTVTFSGPVYNSSQIEGPATTTFNDVIIDNGSNGTLTVGSGDTIRVGTLTVSGLGSQALVMYANSVLEVLTALTINGGLRTAGLAVPEPVITGVAPGYFAFTINSPTAYVVNIRAMRVIRPDDNGMTIAASSALVRLQNVRFENDDFLETGTYFRVLNNITQTFIGMRFDQFCEYSVETPATTSLPVTMRGASGAKGAELYENDSGTAGVIDPGTIIWATSVWTGTTDINWNTSTNWDPVGVPNSTSGVAIGAAPFEPTINSNVTISSMVIQDGVTVTGSNLSLRVFGVLELLDDAGAGSPGRLEWTPSGGTITASGLENNGEVLLNNGASTLRMTVLASLDNHGTFTNNTDGAIFSVFGNFSNFGTFKTDNAANDDSFTVRGSWLNDAGTITWGSGTVSLSGSFGDITTNGQPFNNLYIDPLSSVLGADYSATDALDVTGTLTIDAGGILRITNSLSFGTLTANSGSTVDFAGTAAQAIPAGTYHHLTISNLVAPVALGGDITVNGDLTIEPGAILDGLSHTITMNGNWVNNGSFAADNSNVILAGAASSIDGTTATTFHILTLTGTVDIKSTLVKVSSAWINNGATFTAASSTVEFAGSTPTIGGTTTTTFNILEINASATLSLTASTATVQVTKAWHNDGTFTSAGTTVVFNGFTCEILGGAATMFATLSIDSGTILVLNEDDDITVTNLFTVPIGATLILADTAFIRLQNGLIVEGTLLSSGAPTIRDTGTGLTFVVQNTGLIDTAGLLVQNLADAGLVIAADASASVDLDSVAFDDDDGVNTGTFLQFLIPTGTYVFSNCRFGANIEFNVQTAYAAADDLISFPGFSGVNGGEVYENDRSTGGSIADGSIIWPFRFWDGDTNHKWNVDANWDLDLPLRPTDLVLIPHVTTDDPVLNKKDSIAYLVIEDGGHLSTSGDKRTLTVSGGIEIEPDQGAGMPGTFIFSSDDGRLATGGQLLNNGILTFNSDNNAEFNIQADFTNTGTFTNDTDGALFIIAGNMTNSGTFQTTNVGNDDSVRVSGDWTNSGSVIFGAGTVTLDGAAGTITCGDIPFNNLNIPAGSTYIALDSLAVNGTLTVEGRLILTRQFSVAGTMVSTAGTVEFAGPDPQVVPGKAYHDIVVSNLDNDVSVGGSVTASGDVTIGFGVTLNGAAETVTIAGDWICDGLFEPANSTIVLSGVASTIAGSSVTTFNNLTLTGTVDIAVTAAQADTVRVAGAWTNNGGTFLPGLSNVQFVGAGGVIAGISVTEFNDLQISTGASLSITATANRARVRSQFTNNGTFNNTASTVIEFTAAGTIGGVPTVINSVEIAAHSSLTLDNTDDLTATQFLTVPANAALHLRDSSILRLAGLTVTGTFTASGSTPTVRAIAGSFNFEVNDVNASVDIDQLNLHNLDSSGLSITPVLGVTNLDIDGTNFTRDAGSYVGFRYISFGFSPTTNYNFVACSFDANTQYNIQTPVGTADRRVTMSGAAGAAGDEAYENDAGSGGVIDPGSIHWPFAEWTGGAGPADTNWSTATNWSNVVLPALGDVASVPDYSANDPTLNISTSIASLAIGDTKTFTTAGSSRVFKILGSLQIAGPSGAVVFSSDHGRLETGVIINNGNLSLASDDTAAYLFKGDFNNGGVFTNDTDGAQITVSGDFVNAGTVTTTGSTDDSLSVEADWNNSGTINWGTGTVTLTGGDNTITSGSVAFNNLTIPVGSVYTALDDISVTGTLKVEGRLRIKNGLTLGAAFVSAAGTIEFSGDFSQTIPAGAYHHLEINNADNDVVVGGPISVNGILRIDEGATLAGGSQSITVNGEWQNDGDFTGSTSTVILAGANTTIGGSATTTFHNLNLQSGATIDIHVSDMPADHVRIAGTWANNGASFVHGASTVEFVGTSSVVSGSAVTTFQNVRIDAAANVSVATPGNVVKLVTEWSNDGGTFNHAGTTVEFTSVAGSIGGTSPSVFDTVVLTSDTALTVDSSDDLQIDSALTVPAGATLNVLDLCVLRIGTSITVEGVLVTTGAFPTITDTGSKFAFTVNGVAAILDIEGLDLQNMDDNGLTIDTASTSIDIDLVNFKDDTPGATGTYIRFLASVGDAPAGDLYSFSGCFFDDNCLYNVFTHAGMSNDQVVVMVGANGTRGGEAYENDRDTATPPGGGTVTPGSIHWPQAVWDGSESSAWSDPLNWSDGFVPGNISSVRIPQGTPNDPSLNITTTISSLFLEDGVTMTSSSNNLTLMVSGGLIIQVNAELNFSSDGGGFDISGTLDNDGILRLTSDNTAIYNINGTLENDGTFFNDTHGAMVHIENMENRGLITTSNSLLANDITVTGNWVNSGTVNWGTGTATFDGSTGQQLTSGGADWNRIVVANASNGGVSFLDGFTTGSLFNTTPGSTMRFKRKGAVADIFEITESNGLNLTGAAGLLIKLRRLSGSGIDLFEIFPSTGDFIWNVSHVDVKDSVNLAGKVILALPMDPSNSIDSGNTFNWFSQSYFLSTSVAPVAVSGSVDIPSRWFNENDVVTITASAGAGRMFTQWEKDNVRQENPHGDAVVDPLVVLMDAPHIVEANFMDATLETDLDELPDWWEQRMYGSLSNGASSNTDGDGFVDFDEYVTSSSPRDGTAPSRIFVDDDAVYGDGDGSSATPFKLLQQALDSVAPGAVVYLRPGTYQVMSRDITSNVFIFGADPDTTRIVGLMPSGTSTPQLFDVSAERFMLANVQISNFRNNSPIIRYDVGTDTDIVVLENLTFTGNGTDSTTVPMIDNSGVLSSTAVYFLNNLAYGNDGTGAGLFNLSASRLRAIHNTVANNPGGGVTLGAGSAGMLANNILQDNVGFNLSDLSTGGVQQETNTIAGAALNFLNPAKGFYRLAAADLAAIDTGTTTFLLHDKDIVLRADGAVDQGAYEQNSNDIDNDGLVVADEAANGTSDSNPDSDDDGLWDNDEITIHYTLPNDPDTDNDLVPDGDEVDLGHKSLIDDVNPLPGAFVTDFEPPLWTAGQNLSDVMPNQVIRGPAVVTNAAAVDGVQSIEFGGVAGESGAYGYGFTAGFDNMWIEIHFQHPHAPLPTDVNQALHVVGANIAVNDAGFVCFYSGDDENWIVGNVAVPANDWFKVIVHRNIASGRFDTYVDDQLAVADLGAYGSELDNYVRFRLSSVDDQTVRVDRIIGYFFGPYHLVGFREATSSDTTIVVDLTDSLLNLRNNLAQTTWAAFKNDGTPVDTGVLDFAVGVGTASIDLSYAAAAYSASGDTLRIELSNPSECNLGRTWFHTYTHP